LTVDGLLSQVRRDATNAALPHTQESRANTSPGEDDFATGATVTPQTRYRDVDGGDRRDIVLGRTDDQQASIHFWLQTASIAAMVAILIGGIFLFIRSTRVPSADEMFAIIEQADSEGELTLQDNRIDQFLIHYPNDERIAQVRSWDRQADLQRTLKRLLAQARQAGGISRLQPAAQSFIKAMQMREASTTAAQQQLLAWLNVFDPESETGSAKEEMESKPMQAPASGADGLGQLRRRITHRETQRLAELVRNELQRLAETDPSETRLDERIVSLEERLQFAKTLPADIREPLLQGIVQLYENDPWAASVVQKAQSMLDSPSR
jgi:serine/threonine-protein kinase